MKKGFATVAIANIVMHFYVVSMITTIYVDFAMVMVALDVKKDRK